MIRDLYRRLANAWGSKERKEKSRASKSILRRLTDEDLQRCGSCGRTPCDSEDWPFCQGNPS